MEEIYNLLSEHMSYWVITLCMAIESSFIPFPSEIVIIPAAYIAVNQGTLSIPLVILFGTIGALIGAMINYYLAFWLGRPFIHRFADTRMAHMLLITRPGVQAAEIYFDKHGAIGTFVGRLIPAIRQLISIPAGLSKMHIGKFIFFTSLGAGIWNAVLAGLGAFFGKTMPEAVLIEKVQHYSHYVKVGLAAIIVLGFCLYIYKVFEANRHAEAREEKREHHRWRLSLRRKKKNKGHKA